MKEIESLVERAKKYLESSELLYNSGDYESAVSRDYYAMFYMAEAVLLTLDKTYSSHRGVISSFGKNFIKNDVFPRWMGRELNRAFEKRQLSDYEYTFVISEYEAEELHEKSEKFVKKIIRYLEEEGFL
ncbi:MAG: HEPN domain-containing protein [Thermoplasmatota archaeon]